MDGTAEQAYPDESFIWELKSFNSFFRSILTIAASKQ